MDAVGRRLTHIITTPNAADIANRKIGLLGGSFNPAHEGHREISLAALDHAGVDDVWWLISPGNPLKDPATYTDYDARSAIAREIASHPNIQICQFENEQQTQYTIDTLRLLTLKFPDTNFVWLMGADNLQIFDHWRDWQEIATTVPMAIFNRPGFAEKALNSRAAKKLSAYKISEKNADMLWRKPPPVWVFFNNTANPTSSTALRRDGHTIQGISAITQLDNINSMTQNTNNTNTDDISETSPTIHGDVKHLNVFLDYHPAQSDFLADVIDGLSKSQKSLSPKYFYDETGSELFTKITRTEDYYPTRTELTLMKTHMPAIAKAIGDNSAIFEYGSGASEKIRLLIDSLTGMQSYVAMDISREYLINSAQTIATAYDDLTVSAVCADFTMPISLPTDFHSEVDCWTGYFPGSTIGNFPPDAARAFLSQVSNTLGEKAQFVLGFDLIKDTAILNQAYNDKEGLTAAFNLNILTRMQRELDARLVTDDFEHLAFYNENEKRIEMHLRAKRSTTIELHDHSFAFASGETLQTEFSYKFTRPLMEKMLAPTPWSMSEFWTDENDRFALCLLRN